MKSANKRSLFTSCKASKKRTNERIERVSFLMHRNERIKIVLSVHEIKSLLRDK